MSKNTSEMDVYDLINLRVTCMYCEYHGKNSGGSICLANGRCPFESMSLDKVRNICGIKTDDEVKETEKHTEIFLCDCGHEIEVEEGQEEFECSCCGNEYWIV